MCRCWEACFDWVKSHTRLHIILFSLFWCPTFFYLYRVSCLFCLSDIKNISTWKYNSFYVVNILHIPGFFFLSLILISLLDLFIRQAKRLLSQIVERCRNGPGFHSDMDSNSTIQEVLIPASKVGLVIGKGGETIKQLQVCYLRSQFVLQLCLWCVLSEHVNFCSK